MLKPSYQKTLVLATCWMLFAGVAVPPTFAQPDIFWSRTFDFQQNKDHLTSIRNHPDNGLIVAGNTVNPADSVVTPYLIKFDSDLRATWTRVLDDKGRAEEIIGLPNGFFAVGDNDSGMVLASLDLYCNPLWGVNYDETGIESCRGMVGGGTNDWIVFGNTTNPDRALAVSFGIFGGQNWVNEISGFGQDDPMMSCDTRSTGEIAVFYRNPDGLHVRLLHPINGASLEEFQLQPDIPTAQGRGIVTSDGGYLYAGQLDDHFAFMVKCNADGEEEWESAFSTGQTNESYFNQVIETSDGGFLAVGVGENIDNVIYQKAYAVKVDAAGTEEWSFLFPNANYSLFNDVIEFRPGKFAMVGARGADDDEALRGFFAVFGQEAPEPQLSIYLYRTGDYIIPGWGANLWYQARMVNPFDTPVTVNVWREAYLPGGYYYPLDNEPTDLTLPPGETTDLYQMNVPPNAPAGNITLLVSIGNWPDNPTAIGSVIFRKLPFTDVEEAEPNPTLPTQVELTSVAPNPFNSSTTLTLTLPSPQTVTLTVVDILGRQVATLHNGPLSSGQHRLQWDAETYASGMYVVMVADQHGLADTQKILLLR
ncbi:T9SS type A sorting domain-containing protein [bacterium]|nr:T9SS type A sorting domain-containing protein [bacterium]